MRVEEEANIIAMAKVIRDDEDEDTKNTDDNEQISMI